MEQFKSEQLVTRDTLRTQTDPETSLLTMEGEIWIQDDLRMTVKKIFRTIERDAGAYIYTIKYKYHLSRNGAGDIFRYCSPHKSHNQFHHKHTYKPGFTDPEVSRVEGEWPTLGEAIREAEKHVRE